MKYLLWLSHDCTNLEEIAGSLQKQGHDVGLLLVQDGVFMLDKGCPEAEKIKKLGLKVFASKHHVEERGIAGRLSVESELVDYSKMVDLMMEEYDHVVSI